MEASQDEVDGQDFVQINETNANSNSVENSTHNYMDDDNNVPSMHPPSPKENSFGKLERINSRNIFEDLLVESSTSGEEVQHQTCPINEDSKKVNDKSISQESVLSLKKVCTLGVRQCSKESNQKFKNTKDNTNLSDEDLPSDVVNKHDDLIHVTNETENPVLVTNEEGTTEAIDKEVEKEDRTNEEIGSKEKEKEGVIKVTDSQEKMEDGTTMETDNQERKEGETLDSTNNLEEREEGTSENSNDLEEEKEGSKEETESQVRMLDEAPSETMNQVGKENGSTKERDKQEVKEEETVEKQNSKEEKEKELSKDTTNKIVETSKILSASEETSNETPKNSSSKQVNNDNTEVDLEKQDKLPEDTDNEDKRNQSDTIENETTHSVGDKIKLLEQIEDKTTKPESQNDTVDLDCEESENLVIDIQENSYESNVENSVGKKNVDLSSAEAKEDKYNQLGKLIEESKEQKLPEAVDIQENTDSIHGENLVRNSNDVNTDAVKQKEPERRDNQSVFEDGVEEIQTLLQEFVNSSSKPVVISDNSKASLAGTESQIDSSQKGSTTEAAWSTVGLDRCSYCLFTTDQKELLETHMSSCSRKNTKKEEIFLVYSSNNKYGCKNCLFMSAQKKKFEEHVAFHILSDPYICLTCMVTYDSKKEIEKHVKQVHSNKVVKCGLRGSKKINKIIEELHSKKEVTFIGRKVEKKALLPMIDQKEKPAQNFSITTVGSEGSLPVTVEAYNSKIAKNRQFKFGQDNGSQITTKPNTTTILSVPSIPKFTQSVSSIQPKTFSARANAPIFSLAGSVSSSSMPVIASSVHQAVLAQPLTFPGQAAVQGPVLCTVSSQSQPMILVPVQQIQTRGVLAGPFQIKSGQAGSQILPVSKSQFVNISPAPPKPISATAGTQAQRVIVVNTGSSLTTSTAQINSNNQLSQTRNTIPTTVNMIGMQPVSLKLKQQVDSSAGDANGKSAIIKLTVNHGESATKPENQLIFKKTGSVYFCHTCSYKSDFEENFVKHIWEHMHIKNMCAVQEHQIYKQNVQCNIVTKIMDNLKCAAAEAEKKQKTPLESKNTIPEQIVLSSDEEEDVSKQQPASASNEELDLNASANDLQIRITSTFSLRESDNFSDFTATETKDTNESAKYIDDMNPVIEGKENEMIPEKEMFRELSPDRESNVGEVGEINDLVAENRKGTESEIAGNIASSEDSNSRFEKYPQSVSENTELDLNFSEGSTSSNLRENSDSSNKIDEQSDSSNGKDKESPKTEENKGISLKFYQCGFESCGFAVSTSTEFREHISHIHSGAKEFKCAHCGHKSFTEECHFRHISCHAKNQSGLLFKCADGCKFASNILKHFNEHLETVHPALNSYKCSSCQEVFEKINGLINHCETNKLQFVLCPYCTMRDPNRRVILKHISTSHPGKPRQITVTAQLVCQEREMNSFLAPKAKAVSPGPLSEERKGLLNRVDDLPVELDNIKVEKNDSIEEENVTNQQNESEYHCSERDSPYLDVVSIAGDGQTNEKTGYKLGIGALIRCNRCSYLAGSNLLLKKHRVQHARGNDRSRPFCCPVCPTSSDSIMKFEKHINLHEGDHEIKMFMCELCNYQTNVSDKIKFHLQKSHKGFDPRQGYRTRMLRVSVTVYACEICQNLYKSRKEYVAHMSKHGVKVKPLSIDKHHCDCCSFSCDNLASLIEHTRIHLLVTNSSPADEVKQQKVKQYSGPKKPFYIPPGNVFKDFISCSECPFKTKTRLDLLRHIKSHQHLEPKMKKMQKKDANPQERTTRELVKFQFGKRKHSSDNESSKRKREINSESEEETYDDHDFPVPKRKQVAMKSTSGAKSIKQSHSYFLGGDILHKKLQPCFTKEEDEPMFQCVMCKDVFEDKYSLHKHILDHMDVSFYKCSYCENGELEISSMVSHIQKMHRKPIKHTRVTMEIIEDDINRAIHALKAKQHWGEPDSSLPDIKPNVLDQKAFSPYVEQNINSPTVLTNIQSSIILNQPKLTSTPEKNKLPECVIPFGSSYKCIVCNQQAIQSYILVRHAMTHCSLKRFVCPYCDKRSHYKSDVCKHIHMKHKGNKVFVAYDKTNLEVDAQYIAPPIKEQILNAPDNDLQNKSTIRDDVEENVDDVIVKKEPETDTQVIEGSDRKGKKVVVGFRSVYKCLLCKTTFKGKGKIYKHIRETKCKRPLWRCSACKTRKFRSDKEKVIKDHVKEVHQLAKDAKPVLCAINGKVRKHTYPITVLKNAGTNDTRNTTEFGSEETIKERELSGAIATVLKKGDLWKCSNCPYLTNSRANCVRHTFTHSIFKKFGCPVCSFRAKCSRSIKNHLRNCHPRERIRFKIYTEVNNSPKKPLESQKVKEEKVAMTPEQSVSFQCFDCGLVSERKSSMSKHINAKCCTPLKGCSECEYMTIKKDEIADHLKQCHKSATSTDLPLSEKIITVNPNDEPKSPVKAEKKSKLFSLKVKPLIKSPISKPLSNEMKMWSEENEEQSIDCPECNETFFELRTFRDHFVNKHHGKKMLCGECEEYAAHLPSLIFRHARLFHNQTKLEDIKIKAVSQKTIEEKGLDQRLVILYRCPKCGKISRRCSLKKHIYTHYNYKPYQCNHCVFKCRIPKNIKSHISKIHPGKPMTDFTFRKNLKLEKEISDILESSRYQTLSRKSQLNASLGKNQTSSSERIVPSRKMKKEGHESDEDEEEEKDDEEEEPEEEEESEEEDGEPRGDLKNMFSPCHNYKVEFDDRRQKTIYKCSICPYQSTVNKTMVTHFYHHVPHVFKCPYCDFQGYPRSKIANHIVKLHPGKAVHVVDLRQRMGNLKFRNYEIRTHSSKSKQKPKKNMPNMARETRCLNESRATVFRKRKRDQEGTEASKETGKLVYSCNYCNHKANGLYHYRQHLASHNGFKHLVPGTQIESRLKCGYCSYLAVDDDDFKSHMEYHFATRPFSCPYCNFSQYRASGITNHIKRSHPGKTVDVVKESDSSCHIGHEFDAKAMIVDFEPNVKLTDIFAMDPEDFEKLLNKCEVCVIDLNYIPDEKFDAVSKTLGLENEERNVDDELEPNAKKVKRENVCEDKQQLDESEDLETMIANGELKIEENQKYDDVSDDDLD